MNNPGLDDGLVRMCSPINGRKEGRWFCYYCSMKHRNEQPKFKCDKCPCVVCTMGCMNYFQQTLTGFICETCVTIYNKSFLV